MKQNILVVDDHRENLIALEAILEAEGRQLVMAQSGNEALSLALKYDFALVLLDVQMPEMDGFEVAELMRKNRKTRHIPIIFVTAISKEHKYVFRGYQAGAVDYLFKPLDQQILEAKVGVFLELDRQRRKLQQAVVQMKRLKDENERLLQALGEPVLGTDYQGKISFCNDAACAMLNRDRDSLTGSDAAPLLFNDEAGKQRWSWDTSPLFSHCCEGKPWHNEHRLYVMLDSAPLGVQIKANPVTSDNGEVTGMVLVLASLLEVDEGREHRLNPRKKLLHEPVVFDRHTGGNVGKMVNLSVDGFKLFTRHPMKIGATMQLGTVLPEQIAGLNTATFEARVVWCENLDAPNEYEVGFQFGTLGSATKEVIATLMDRY